NVIRYLGEPAEIADDERPSERERANGAAGRLSHRGRAQRDAGIARGHQRPELLLLDVTDALHAFRHESVRVEPGRCGPDEQELRVRMTRADEREGLDQLRDALARIQMPEAAEERPAFLRSRLNARRGPRGVLDAPDRSVVSGLDDALLDVARMHDQAGRVGQHLAGERELVRARFPRRRYSAIQHSMRK